MTLQFEIQGQLIRLQPHPSIAADSIGYLTAAFTFPSDWIGTKSAIFTGSDGVPYTVLLDESGTCMVPWEVIKAPYFTVSAFAGERITATTVEVPVLQSGYAEGKTPEEPTPTAYEQLVQLVKSEKEAAEAAAERAEVVEIDVEKARGDVVTALNYIKELLEENSPVEPVKRTPSPVIGIQGYKGTQNERTLVLVNGASPGLVFTMTYQYGHFIRFSWDYPIEISMMDLNIGITSNTPNMLYVYINDGDSSFAVEGNVSAADEIAKAVMYAGSVARIKLSKTYAGVTSITLQIADGNYHASWNVTGFEIYVIPSLS